MFLVVRTNRNDGWFISSDIFQKHLEVHKKLHAAPKARGVRRTTNDEEKVASSYEYRQTLKVRFDAPLVDADFIQLQPRQALVGSSKLFTPFTQCVPLLMAVIMPTMREEDITFTNATRL